ncbi:MAG TPA: hypothetical protein VGO78_11950 [Acidimicrobiales bacterium]|nr:hypothetical protein [Acidimicrobiales bacterium]
MSLTPTTLTRVIGGAAVVAVLSLGALPVAWLIHADLGSPGGPSTITIDATDGATSTRRLAPALRRRRRPPAGTTAAPHRSRSGVAGSDSPRVGQGTLNTAPTARLSS